MILKPGYIALMSVIILLFLVLTVGVVSSIGSISQLQIVESSNTNLEGTLAIDSCVEDALLRLNLESDVPASFSIGDEISCTINIEDQTLNQWTLLISSGDKQVRVIASRSDKVYISKWETL